MSKSPSDDILESLYKLRIRESAQLKTVLELYDMEIHQKISMPNYQKLKTMVKKRKDQHSRVRNFDARQGRIETGAGMKNRKETSGVEGGKRIPVTSGQKKASVRKVTSAVSGMRVTIVPKNQNTLPPGLPSHPSHEVEVFRRKEVSKAESNHGAILRQPCRYYLKDTCTRSLCEYWHPPEYFTKQKRDAKPGISVCSRIIKLMNNRTKSQRKATITKKEEKATTRMQWLL